MDFSKLQNDLQPLANHGVLDAGLSALEEAEETRNQEKYKPQDEEETYEVYEFMEQTGSYSQIIIRSLLSHLMYRISTLRRYGLPNVLYNIRYFMPA